MNAVVYAAKDRVRAQVVDKPHLLEPTDALVRVTLSGICGTDLHLVGGDFSGIEARSVMGHEFVGDVVEIGTRCVPYGPAIACAVRISRPAVCAAGAPAASIVNVRNAAFSAPAAPSDRTSRGLRPSTFACRSPTSHWPSCPRAF